MRTLGLMMAAALIAGCGGMESQGTGSVPEASSAAQAKPAPQASAPGYDRPEQRQLRRALEELIPPITLESLFQHELLSPLELSNPGPLPGLSTPRNWMSCDGYLTNNAAAGFCEATPPDNWRPFDFNGQRYYVIPLSA